MDNNSGVTEVTVKDTWKFRFIYEGETYVIDGLDLEDYKIKRVLSEDHLFDVRVGRLDQFTGYIVNGIELYENDTYNGEVITKRNGLFFLGDSMTLLSSALIEVSR